LKDIYSYILVKEWWYVQCSRWFISIICLVKLFIIKETYSNN
jgi:hypothetical protein